MIAGVTRERAAKDPAMTAWRGLLISMLLVVANDRNTSARSDKMLKVPKEFQKAVRLIHAFPMNLQGVGKLHWKATVNAAIAPQSVITAPRTRAVFLCNAEGVSLRKRRSIESFAKERLKMKERSET